MYAYMMAHEDELPTDNKQGEDLASKGGYVFLMESSSIEYIIERNCDGNYLVAGLKNFMKLFPILISCTGWNSTR